jgi:hypothetical protein
MKRGVLIIYIRLFRTEGSLITDHIDFMNLNAGNLM